MFYTRIYADEDGVTHFEDIPIETSPKEFAPPAPAFFVSAALDAAHIVFYTMPSGWVGDWHPAPRRQYRIVLAGEVEVAVSDGEVRRFVPGDVALLDDIGSIGHVTRVIGPNPYEAMFVQI